MLETTPCPTPAEVDRVARVIAAAVWRPKPDMRNDIWLTLTSMQRRNAEMAAIAAIEEMRNGR
jgi:hypothetical protein